jgi:hypothetical protein
LTVSCFETLGFSANDASAAHMNKKGRDTTNHETIARRIPLPISRRRKRLVIVQRSASGMQVHAPGGLRRRRAFPSC